MIAVAICMPSGVEPLPEVIDALGGHAVLMRADTVWQARRRAVADCDSEVLAFVDGDVRVAPGWLERLEAAWTEAPQEIAAIGGPVRVRGGMESREVAGAVDLGGEALDLDPLERTLIAGNLSFRCAPLIGVGGFAPTVDRRDSRDWFAEEHEAQRQLGHWGWLVRYDPALAAERVPGWDGATRAARFRYGVRLGIARDRSSRVAAQAMGRAAAGAAIAAGMGCRDTARRRVTRAAENSGVLLAPVVAPKAWRRHGLWPADAAPPARPRDEAPVVLLYHRIAEGESDPLGLCVSPANFAEQIEIVRDRVVAIEEIAAGSAPSGAVAVTFDDGYADNLAPLRSCGIPVTLFAATGHVASGRSFFWDEAARLIISADTRPAKLRLDVDGRPFEARMRTPAEREAVFRHLHGVIQPQCQAVIESVLVQLAAWAGQPSAPPEDTRLVMTPAELTSLAQAGVTIGAHTRNHVNLAHQPAEVVAAEVEGSRDDIEEWTGTRPRGFSYPFGLPRHDVNAIARQAAEAAGFAYAVVNQPIPVPRGADPFAVPRLSAPDLGGAAFHEWLTTKLAGRA